MAMNNWGGNSDHMSKKPRKFLSHKRTKRDFGDDNNHQLSEKELEISVKRKAAKIREELSIYLLIFILIILGVILYS